MNRFTLGFLLCTVGSGLAQNVVGEATIGPTLPRAELEPALVERVVAAGGPTRTAPSASLGSERVRAKLAAHVDAMLRGSPWRPFHCTLGISGSETYFDHPDEFFFSLSLALPHLPAEMQGRVRGLLAAMLATTPPYAVDGFERSAGRARERYDVAAGLISRGRGKARSLFGVAAFATYLQATSAGADAEHWGAIRARVLPILDRPYALPAAKQGARTDSAEILNGDLAGLFAFARFAKAAGDGALYQQTIARLTELAQMLVNLERTDTNLLVPASTASKQLHHFKVARLGSLHRDVAQLLAAEERKLASARLLAFREARPGWWMAFGDRFIGGENYISPPHLSLGLVRGASLIEQKDADTLAGWIDVPWCEADLYFIEKCARALGAE